MGERQMLANAARMALHEHQLSRLTDAGNFTLAVEVRT
jgi:hypothetical protein